VVLFLMLGAGVGVLWLWWGWRGEQKTIGQLRTLHQRVDVAPIGPPRLRWVLGDRLGYLTERVDTVAVWRLGKAETKQFDFRSLAYIQELSLAECELTNSDLTNLGGMRKLRELSLDDLKIENPDLAFLEKLPALSSLTLTGNWVPRTGLKHVVGLKNLKNLALPRAGMNDGDLQQLQGLFTLEQLDLRGNPISDVGLGELKGLKSLRFLKIDKTLLDSSGAAKLRHAIPGLNVDNWDVGIPW